MSKEKALLSSKMESWKMKKPWIIWYECPHYFWTEFISATIHKLVRKVQFSPFLFFARLFDLYTELQIRDQTNFGSTSDEYSYVAPWGLKICKDSRFVSINPPFCCQTSGWLPVCWKFCVDFLFRPILSTDFYPNGK